MTTKSKEWSSTRPIELDRNLLQWLEDQVSHGGFGFGATYSVHESRMYELIDAVRDNIALKHAIERMAAMDGPPHEES